MWGYVFDKLEAEANFNYQTTSVCFFGHTHVPLAFEKSDTVRGGYYTKINVTMGKKYFVNVGSVGQPRDGDPRAAYAIYDLINNQIELRRIAYDFRVTQQKILDAGLPGRVAARLGRGSLMAQEGIADEKIDSCRLPFLRDRRLPALAQIDIKCRLQNGRTILFEPVDRRPRYRQQHGRAVGFLRGESQCAPRVRRRAKSRRSGSTRRGFLCLERRSRIKPGDTFSRKVNLQAAYPITGHRARTPSPREWSGAEKFSFRRSCSWMFCRGSRSQSWLREFPRILA